MLKTVLSVLLLLLGSARLPGQPATTPVMADGVWRVNLGVGGGGIGIALGASLQFETDGHLLALEGLYNQGLDILSSRDPESVGEIGLLYGRSWRRPYILYTVSAGLAYVGGRKHAEIPPEGYQGGGLDERYTDHDFSTVGVPLKGELIIRAFPWLGVGAAAFANLNTRRSVAGAMLLLSIGSL